MGNVVGIVYQLHLVINGAACEIEQVAHPATYKALEDKHVHYKRGMVAASVLTLIDLVALLDSQIVGIGIDMTVGLHLRKDISSE